MLSCHSPSWQLCETRCCLTWLTLKLPLYHLSLGCWVACVSHLPHWRGSEDPDLKCDELLNRLFVGDGKLPVKECSSPWGTSKARRIEPIRLTVSSMSCDLSMVMAYYDDKWTHLSNWSLSTHFSSFLESWGHYLSASDRRQWQPRRQRAHMTRHRWLFPPMNLFTEISKEMDFPSASCVDIWKSYHADFLH